MRLKLALAFLCAAAFALPARAQDFRMKLQEEIHTQRDRAHELQTIAQSDERMAQELNGEAQGLTDHANRMDQRARELRAFSNQPGMPPGQIDTLNHIAGELDGYARSDRSQVDFRRRVANDMAQSAQGAFQAAKQHEDQANRMQSYLDQLNAQQPPQGGVWR